MILSNKFATAWILAWLLVSFCQPSVVKAQFRHAMVEKLVPDTAAIIHLENLDRGVTVFENSIEVPFEEVLQFCAEEPSPLLSLEAVREIQNQVVNIKSLLTVVDEAELVIHQWQINASPEFTAFLYLDADSAEELAQELTNIQTLLQKIVGKQTKVGSELNKGLSLQGISISQAEVAGAACVMLTNTKYFASEFSETDTPKKNITTSRRYRTFEAFTQRKKASGNTPLLTAFLEPKRLRPILDNAKQDEVWEALEIDELPVAALYAAIDDEDVIFADAMITNTVPPSGTSAKWLAFRELAPLPVLDFEVVKLASWGVDSAEMYRQQEKFYDNAYGKGTFSKLIVDYYGNNEPEFLESISQRTDLKLEVRVLGDRGRTTILNFERIKNEDAMIEVVSSLVQKQNQRLGKKYGNMVRTDRDGTIVWEHPNINQKKMIKPTAHAIAGGWYIFGEQPYVRKQIAMMEEPCEEIEDAVPEEASKSTRRFAPTALTHYTLAFWYYHARANLAERAIRRGKTNDSESVVEIVKAIRFQNAELEIRSKDDRLAVARFRLYQSFFKRFGSVTNLFRAQPNHFESQTIIGQPENALADD